MWDFYSGITDTPDSPVGRLFQQERKMLPVRLPVSGAGLIPACSYQLSTLYSCVTPDNVLSVFEPPFPICNIDHHKVIIRIK